MSAPRDFSEYLSDMVSEAQYAQQFVEGVTYEEFVTNPEKQRAVARFLELICKGA